MLILELNTNHSLTLSFSIYLSDGCPFGNHLQDSNWTYSFHGTTATIEFTENGFVGLEFNAQGHILKEFVCHGDEANVFVLR